MPEETYLQTLRRLHQMTLFNGLPPTMAALGFARRLSPSAIAKHYAVLVEHGLIRHQKRSPRSAVLTAAGKALVRRGSPRAASDQPSAT